MTTKKDLDILKDKFEDIMNCNLVGSELKCLLLNAVLNDTDVLTARRAARLYGTHPESFTAAFSEARPAMSERSPAHKFVTRYIEKIDSAKREIIMKKDKAEE